MARPKKQTIDYFPHYVSGGKTLFILESTFGNDGYAFWFKLLELLGSTEGHYYDINNSADWRFLLAKTKVSEETGTKILNTLAELNAIDSDLWEEKVIWVQHLVDNVSDVYKKRGTEIPLKPSFCHENSTLPIVSDSENPQSKVKETKVKEIKVVDNSSTTTEALEVFKYAEKCNFILSPLDREKIASDIEIFSLEEVMKALEIANDRGKRSYGYFRGILNSRRAGTNEKADKESEMNEALRKFVESDEYD